MTRFLALSLAICLTGCGESSAPDRPTEAARAAVQPAPAAASATVSPPSPTQTMRYDADAPGDQAQTLPAAIARGLGTDELVLSCADGTRDGVSRFAADWVGIDRLDLNDDGRADWIVHGRNACLRQPDAAYWWLYENTADEGAADEGAPRLLLRAEPAGMLEILPTSTRGYRDLRMHLNGGRGELVADTRYDGQAYSAAPP